MAEPTTDFPWFAGFAAELAADLAGRTVRIRRHPDHPFAWIDGGGARSWVADATPGAGNIRRVKPDDGDDWRPWGGRRTDGTEVEGAEIRGGDRVLAIRLRWRSRLGDDVRTELVLEIGGRQTNAVLVDPSGVVVDVLRPVSSKVNRMREVLPGRRYAPPPHLGRARVDEPWSWEAADDRPVAQWLARSFLAMSRSWAEEIVRRAEVGTDIPARDLPPDARDRLERAASEMIADPEPWIVLDAGGAPVDHLAFRPGALPEDRVRRAESFAAAVDAVWAHRPSAETTRADDTQDNRVRTERRNRLERQRDRLREEIAKADGAGEKRRLADLIMAHLAEIPPDAAEVELVDWLDPTQRTVVVRMNPLRKPVEQAEQLYRTVRRMREAVPLLRARLARTEATLARLAELETGDIVPEGAPMRREANETDERKSDHGIHPRRYRTRDGGWLVLVGRNDGENDVLSLKVAAADDLWFHAQGCPGSHVVLRREGRPEMPSRAAVGEAAGLAAYWSKARGASKVGVSWTLAKNVGKPRGAPQGTVTIRGEKLVTVPPALLPLDDDTEERG